MDEAVREKFETYPTQARERLLEIRALIYEVAADDGVGDIQESLKWGEPSYASKIGSPIRMDWKAKNPERVSVFFNCQTLLVETFREIYGDGLGFVGNREVFVLLSAPLPLVELRGCISLALRYREVKGLPLLGA